MSRDWSEVKEYCEKATPGPWEFGRHRDKAGNWPARYEISQCGEMYDHAFVFSAQDGGEGKANAELISTARTALPEAIAEIEQLTKGRNQAWADLKLMSGVADTYAEINKQLRQEKAELENFVNETVELLSAAAEGNSIKAGETIKSMLKLLAKLGGGEPNAKP